MNSNVTNSGRVALTNGNRQRRPSSSPTFDDARPRYFAPGPFHIHREGQVGWCTVGVDGAEESIARGSLLLRTGGLPFPPF